jgi:hypothetical protein
MGEEHSARMSAVLRYSSEASVASRLMRRSDLRQSRRVGQPVPPSTCRPSDLRHELDSGAGKGRRTPRPFPFTSLELWYACALHAHEALTAVHVRLAHEVEARPADAGALHGVLAEESGTAVAGGLTVRRIRAAGGHERLEAHLAHRAANPAALLGRRALTTTGLCIEDLVGRAGGHARAGAGTDVGARRTCAA